MFFMPWKRIGGSGGTVSLIINLSLDEVSGQPHALALFTPGRSLTPIEEESGWVSKPVWTLWRRRKSIAFARYLSRMCPVFSPHLYVGHPRVWWIWTGTINRQSHTMKYKLLLFISTLPDTLLHMDRNRNPYNKPSIASSDRPSCHPGQTPR